MSLLSQQLKVIGEKNASLAVDRKSRQQIHSRSLLFDAKTAASQDFDYIFQIASEGLEELIEIDSRFEKFSSTLFSEASIDFDRNVKTKDILDPVNRNLEAFMNLAAPYYHLAPTLKAMEWLVRRYHVNIHNSELLFLSTLSYHSQPVFTRIMNAVPKGSMPHIFSWISLYKEQSKPLPASSVLKSFHNDPALFRLYSEYLREQLKHKTIYKEQLVFYLSNTAQVLASYARNTEKLNDDYIVTVLEAVNDLLLPQNHEFKYSSTLKEDIKLTAYGIISILTSVLPLIDELVYSLTISILSDPFAWNNLRRQTLVVLGQLWNFYNEDDVSEEAEVFANLSSEVLLKNEELLLTLIEESYNISKFVFFFVIDKLNHNDDKAIRLLQFIDVPKNDLFFSVVVKKLLLYITEKCVTDEGRAGAVSTFEQLLKSNKSKVVNELRKQSKSISDLEMILMHTMGESANESAYDGDNEDVVIENNAVNSSSEAIKSKETYFLSTAANFDFFKIVDALLRELKEIPQNKQISYFLKASKRAFLNDVAHVSFLIRLGFTVSVPLSSRLVALGCTRATLQHLAEKNQSLNLYLLAPIILLGLSDESKPFRDICVNILLLIQKHSQKIIAKGKQANCTLFMESEIYPNVEEAKKSLISPNDANTMLSVLLDDRAIIDDVRFDHSRASYLLFDVLFKSTKGGRKFGSLLLKSFVYGQWASPSWPLAFKHRVWRIIGSQNKKTKGFDDRFYFVTDAKDLLLRRNPWIHDASAEGLNAIDDIMKPVASMVGGLTTNEKKRAKEIDWVVRALSTEDQLQVVANERVQEIFPLLKVTELKVGLCKEFIELLIKETDSVLHFDPLDTLQGLEILNEDMVALLNSVNIVTEVPEQSVPKRRRRSSSSTQKNMARDDINTMAAAHLRKLSVILDVLETQLRKSQSLIADSDLLQVLFKILTDLDYLGNDGKLPILYAQETLASCMQLCVVKIKESQAKHRIDSNSIRADLIVNSIRLSQSPQVQNRLLLVIAELASLAPEIILHSVMPIFTFMGAHTVRQDDEFSSSALQQTISKVVPAITAASSSISTEIDFLLTSFVTAFQHIPRHRRVKLFVSLVQTLGHENALQKILFLVGQQYSANLEKNKVHECNSLLDFTAALLKTFDAQICLEGINNFFSLWNRIPKEHLNGDSEELTALSSKPIFGSAVANATDEELKTLRVNLLKFLNLVLGTDEELSLSTNLVSLKMKVALVLFDDQSPKSAKEFILKDFSRVTSFILASLDSHSGSKKWESDVVDELYEALKCLLNLLPMSYYVTSIAESLKNANDALSVTVAKNFAILAGTKFENEMNANSFDDAIESTVLEELLPILVEGFEKYDNVELVQAYLDTFSIIVSKLGLSLPEIASSENAKHLIGTLKVITSTNGLLSSNTEIVVSSLNAVASVVKIFGVKCIGFFPKILPPALKIWESTARKKHNNDDEDFDDEDLQEKNMLLQGSILMLISVLVKRLPAFVVTNLKQIVRATVESDLVDSSIRSKVLELIVEHVDKSQVLVCLLNLALNDNFYAENDAKELGLYLNSVRSSIDSIEKKSATANSSLFMKWLIKSFEFRNEFGEDKFEDNTINSIESSFHQCAIVYVMKLNDKSFRPLFANMVRWAATGEGSISSKNTEVTRLVAFFKFFNKLQDRLKSIITSYFSYMIDPTVSILNKFASGDLKETNLRRIVLNALVSSFKYDQDDYWSHQLRFETIINPLLSQLKNIEKPIGKYLVRAITSFVTNVSSEEHNEKLVHGLIYYISNEHENSLNTKLWTVRVLREVFLKLGEQWLTFLPTFIPYIAELLEDDDEDVELEVRKDLVRVIENVLGEPLERYLS